LRIVNYSIFASILIGFLAELRIVAILSMMVNVN